MPGLQPTSDAQFEATQAELRQQVKPTKQELGNVGLAADMLGPAYIRYGRYRYRVDPISYPLGIELEEIKLKLDELADLPPTHENNMALLETFDRAVQLFPKVVKPMFGFQKLLWRFTSNPFRGASASDIFQLLYFFCSCRTRSVVRFEETSLLRKSRSSTTLQII